MTGRQRGGEVRRERWKEVNDRNRCGGKERKDRGRDEELKGGEEEQIL